MDSLRANACALGLCLVASGCASNVFPLDGREGDAVTTDEGRDAGAFDAGSPTDVPEEPIQREPAEGYVEAMTNVTNGAPADSFVDAHFFSRVGMPPCRIAMDGNCSFRLCDRGDGGYQFPPLSAGELRVRDEAHDGVIVLPYRASSHDYGNTSLGTNYWPPGVHVDLIGTGDAFGPFDVTLQFPAPTALVGFMPEYDSRSVVVDRARDMPMRWMAGSTGTLSVTISVGTSDSSARLECHFPANFPAGTIMASQLALLPITGPDAGSIDISVVDQVDRVIADPMGGGQQVVHARVGYVLFASSAGTR